MWVPQMCTLVISFFTARLPSKFVILVKIKRKKSFCYHLGVLLSVKFSCFVGTGYYITQAGCTFVMSVYAAWIL